MRMQGFAYYSRFRTSVKQENQYINMKTNIKYTRGVASKFKVVMWNDERPKSVASG